MGFQYHLEPNTLLTNMGYSKSTQPILIEQQSAISIPQTLHDFLAITTETKLFSTSEIWKQNNMCTLYDYIAEDITDEKEYWEKDLKAAQKNEYFKFYRLDQSKWTDLVPNYLLIGSDFAAGIITFGILFSDLDQKDPPVYMHHESDPLGKWIPYTKTVSEFLMISMCDALSCVMYDTAMDTLEADDWDCKNLSKEEVNKYKIDFDAVVKYPSFYDSDLLVGCCFDPILQVLVVINFSETSREVLNGIAYHKNKK